MLGNWNPTGANTWASVEKQVSCARILGMGNDEITSHLVPCAKMTSSIFKRAVKLYFQKMVMECLICVLSKYKDIKANYLQMSFH